MLKSEHEQAAEQNARMIVRDKLVTQVVTETKADGKPSEAEYLLTLVERDTAKPPRKDKLADRSCPACGAYINWDALNDPINYAPEFCKSCGQRFDWSKEEKFHDEY